MTALVIAVAASLFVTTAFLCAAVFVAVLNRYGLVEACLAGAGIYLVVTLLAPVFMPHANGRPPSALPMCRSRRNRPRSR